MVKRWAGGPETVGSSPAIPTCHKYVHVMTQTEGVPQNFDTSSAQYELYSRSPIVDFGPEDLQPDQTGENGVFWVYPQVLGSDGLPDMSSGQDSYLMHRKYLPKSTPHAHLKGRSVTGELRVNNDPLVSQLGSQDEVYALEMALGVVELRTVGLKRKRQEAVRVSLRPGTLFSIKPLLGPVENS